MVKYILVSRNAFFNDDKEIRSEIIELYNKINREEIQIVFVSRTLAEYKGIIEQVFGKDEILLGNRRSLSGKFIEGSSKATNKDFVLIGAIDEDIRIGANNKIILFNPTWIDVEEKIEKYGFEIGSISNLYQCINILNLEKGFMYDTKIDERTTLIALCDAREYYAVANEKEMLKRYKNVLKYNQVKYQYAVYFHYLCNLFNDERFSDVDYWMAVPSSSGKNANYIYEMVKNTRYILNNRKSEDLFIRHIEAPKSTYLTPEERIAQGCTRHLETIHLNPKYKKQLKGKKICIIDDYVNNGTSFDTLRNLLKELEVSEIILLAVGTFQKPYIREDYNIFGDVFNGEFSFEKTHSTTINHYPNYEAQRRIKDIYDIIR